MKLNRVDEFIVSSQMIPQNAVSAYHFFNEIELEMSWSYYLALNDIYIILLLLLYSIQTNINKHSSEIIFLSLTLSACLSLWLSCIFVCQDVELWMLDRFEQASIYTASTHTYTRAHGTLIFLTISTLFHTWFSSYFFVMVPLFFYFLVSPNLPIAVSVAFARVFFRLFIITTKSSFGWSLQSNYLI